VGSEQEVGQLKVHLQAKGGIVYTYHFCLRTYRTARVGHALLWQIGTLQIPDAMPMHLGLASQDSGL
jgi:hypothetical protein